MDASSSRNWVDIEKFELIFMLISSCQDVTGSTKDGHGNVISHECSYHDLGSCSLEERCLFNYSVGVIGEGITDEGPYLASIAWIDNIL